MQRVNRVTVVTLNNSVELAKLDNDLLTYRSNDFKKYNYGHFTCTVFHSGRIMFWGSFSDAELREVSEDVAAQTGRRVIHVEVRNETYNVTLFKDAGVAFDLDELAQTAEPGSCMYQPLRFPGARLRTPNGQCLCVFRSGAVTATGVKSRAEAVETVRTLLPVSAFHELLR